VLLDVKLPDMSGHEVCRRLKADDATIPILQISASYVSGPDKVRGLDNGADAYLVKPVEADELIATIRALLRMREAEEARRETEQRYELCLRVVRCQPGFVISKPQSFWPSIRRPSHCTDIREKSFWP